MTDLVSRGYEQADAPALAELLDAVVRHGGGHSWATAEALHAYLSHGVRELAIDSRLWHAPGGRLVAAGAVTVPPAGGTHANLPGGVHPDWQGRGLGREVLGWQLHRAAQIHRAVAPEADWSAHADTPAGDRAAVWLFQRAGLAPVRYWFAMVAATGAATMVALPDGLRVAGYAMEQEAALHRAHLEAFAGHWGFQRRSLPEWAPLTVRSAPFLPELSLLAYDRDELAGYILSYQDGQPDRIYVGQVGVRPAWRRRGLASALLARVLAAASAAGIARVGLGVDADSPTGAVGVYRRAGFTVESRSVSYAIRLVPDRPG